MNQIQSTPFKKNLLLFVFSIVFTLLLNSCATKVNFAVSTIAPAAVGHVKIKKDKNNNYALQITISNLASPERLQPTRRVYIVWAQDAENNNKNVGQITTSTQRLSKALKASLAAVTTFKPVRVFITAEDDSNIQYPGNQVVLTTGQF
jgi:uncharacterized protein YpmS